MRILKNIFSMLHIFLLWMLLSAVFWGWIFTFVTDTSPDRKVSVYCHVPEINDKALAVSLEENMPDGLRMIKVHSFDYVMFDVESIGMGDIFIIPASEIEQYSDSLLYMGADSGVKVYDASSRTGVAEEYISYSDEDHYLFLGAGSVHLEDGKALAVAQQLLAMD